MTTDLTRARGEPPMTAAELHALMAPLWKVAPETRPDGLWYGSEDVGDNLAMLWTLHGDILDIDRPEIPAALCEVAVMRWLLSIKDAPVTLRGGFQTYREFIIVKMSDADCQDEPWAVHDGAADVYWFGVTPLHALVAAALSVLSAGRGEG